MTDTPERPANEGSDPAPPGDEANVVPRTENRTLWGRLNRTNRVAALMLGGIAAVLVAALIFGAGLLVGAEYGDSEGHHHGEGDTAELRDGDRASSDREMDEETADAGRDETDDAADQAQHQDEGLPDTPADEPPTETSGAPRPR